MIPPFHEGYRSAPATGRDERGGGCAEGVVRGAWALRGKGEREVSVLEVVRRMHVYNQWADEQIFAAMAGLTAEDIGSQAAVAFGSLRGSLWHHLGAQMGWLRICAGYDTWSKVKVRDSTSIDGLRELFDGSHTMWRGFIESRSEDDVLRDAELPIDENFRTSVGPELLKWADENGHRPRRPMWQSMLHVVNHSTQHRSEVGMYLLTLGRSPGDLDYGTFEENRSVGLEVAGWAQASANRVDSKG